MSDDQGTDLSPRAVVVLALKVAAVIVVAGFLLKAHLWYWPIIWQILVGLWRWLNPS